MNGIKEKSIQYLHKLHDLVDANEIETENMFVVGEKLGFQKELTEKIIDYLIAENFIGVEVGENIRITHAGIRRVED